MDPAFLSAAQLVTQLRGGKIGCLELLDHYIDRVERLDTRINAVVVRDFDRARVRARALDAQPERSAPLFGVPMTIKESFDVAGLPTTWGVPAYRDTIAGANALAVDRLLAGGVVLFGKTNVPLLLADWQSYNDISGFYLLPATVAPLGFSPEGLPIGVQIVGAHYADRTTIEVAKLLETAWQGFVPPTGWT